MAKQQQKVVAFAFLVIVAVGGYYWMTFRETPGSATEKLNAQNIEVSQENFFAEVKAGHIENVHNFLLTGADFDLQDASGNTPLLVAVDSGNKDMVSYILQKAAAAPDAAKIINYQNPKTQKTPLMLAVEKNDATVMNLLLTYNADTAITDKTGETSLVIAAKKGAMPLIPALIEADIRLHHGSSINQADTGGDTPLTYAIRKNNQAMIDTLLAAKADAVSADGSGVTPIMIAAETGNTDAGTKLIAAGAKPDTADRMGNTPLTIAITHSQPAFARLLISKGANPDFHSSNGPTSLQATINTEPLDTPLFSYLLTNNKEKANVNATVLFSAIDHKNAELAKVLLEHGISAQSTNQKDETLLYHAIEVGLEDTALLLIDKGANINQTGIPGVSPLERATKHNEAKVVQKLLSLGVSPDLKTSEGYTLAEMAVYSGYPEILDALLAKGAKLEKDFGVLWSIRDGGGRSVPVLLKYGAKPTVMSNSGDPALWLAASLGETEAVAALIKSQAAVDAPNAAQSMTPLAIASHSGHLPVVKLLLDAGAKLEAADAFGMTPLAHAAYMTKPDVVSYLLSKGANIHSGDKQGRSISDLAALAAPSTSRDQVMTLLQQTH